MKPATHTASTPIRIAITICLLSIIAPPIAAQTSHIDYIFRIYLKDKGRTEYSTEKPGEFLSKKAIDRKMRQQAPIDSTDFPISPDYFRAIALNRGEVVAHSKWFKTLAVKLADSTQIAAIQALPFVDSVRYIWRGTYPDKSFIQPRPRLDMPECDKPLQQDSLFGITQQQFAVHNAQHMIQAGFRGKGISIGVIDAGFTNTDVIPWFQKTHIVSATNFVPHGQIYADSDHGTKVLSTMCVNQPGIMMGSAPEAQYHLLQSEDTLSEYPVEEDYWVQAIEHADSIGIDLVNTSLGYNTFDDPTLNYRHQDLTGNISLMSRAANMAVEKGMIVVAGAGNEGRLKWRKITPPNDAPNILSVGAIGTDSIIATFSSVGLTADQRIKPDVVSIGRNTYTIGPEGTIETTNGTSLSSPFMAGLIASLWSVNPNLNRMTLLQIVKQASDRYNTPDSIYGQGIPDFQKALRATLRTLPVHHKQLRTPICHISTQGRHYSVKLINPPLHHTAYTIALITENGTILTSARINSFDGITLTPPPHHHKRLYFLLQSPIEQYTWCIEP